MARLAFTAPNRLGEFMAFSLHSAARRTANCGALLTLLAGTVIVGVPLAVQPTVGSDPALAVGAAGADPGSVDTSLTSLRVPEVSAARGEVVAQLSETATRPFGVVGVTWEGGSAPADLTVQVRTRVADVWSRWKALEVEAEGPTKGAGVRAGTIPVWAGDADGVGVRLLSAQGTAPDDVRVAVIDGDTGLAEPALAPVAGTTDAAVTAMPDIVSRASWGVDTSGQGKCSPPRRAETMKGVVLHHTVGSNDYTKAEAPGIVRAIHLYHTKQRGWCDVGYNFLVDKYGVAYEGRRGGTDRQVRAAHAGNWEANLYTTGISMMGNLETEPVTTAMKDAVIQLTAWRLSSFGRRPFGKITIDGAQLPRISGHRDIYLSGMRPATATACPGEHGHHWLNSGMRKRVKALMDAAAEDAAAEDAAAEDIS